MSYQPCRWYDPYPRLAFALKLLYLAPTTIQSDASRHLQNYLMSEWGRPAVSKSQERPNGNRWYDNDPQMADMIDILRDSPDYLKTRAANELLKLLGQDSLR